MKRDLGFAISVTRLGNLLDDFGQLFKVLGHNLFAQISYILKLSKSLIVLVKSFLGNFYRHLAIFTGHTGLRTRGREFNS